MMSGRYGLVLREVGRLLGGGTVGALGAGPLLERFAVDRDGAAFEALVTRHGPMVLGTCRRMLSDPHDVDDAFQATFLVLARKAGSIRDADRLGPWLHGVARRVAARSRALSGRRKSVERRGCEEPAFEPPDLLEGSDLREALDEELARLPEKYRAPLVLCYLEGLTHDEAAEALRWPVGTVRSRLAGGRDRLRVRLARRGLSPSAAVPALLPAGALPPALLSTTVRVATSAGSPSAHVLTLAKGALIAMTWNKLKMIAALGLMAGLTVGGAGVAAQKGEAGKAEAPAAEEMPTTLDQVEKEMMRVKTEAVAADKKLKELRSQHEQMMRPLEKSFGELDSRYGELVDQWKRMNARATSTAADDLIKRLEAELRASRSEIQEVRRKLDALATETARPVIGDKAPPKPDAPPVKPEQTPGAETPSPEPRVMTLNSNLGLFAVISANNDRVTIIDSATQRRSSFRMARGANEIVPIVNFGPLITLMMKGPAIDRLAVFDSRDMTWSEHELREPATKVHPLASATGMIGFQLDGPKITQLVVFSKDWGWFTQDLREPAQGSVSPIVMNSIISCRIGRFLYNFSGIKKSWAVLELKKEDGAPQGTGSSTVDHGVRMVITEGDLIHLYDAKTGEWTHIDTKDEK